MKQLFLQVINNSFIKNSSILFVGTMVVNILNYFFHLIVGRIVTPAVYGEIESLISLLTIISVPAATLTLIATNYAASMKAEGNILGVQALNWYLTKKVLIYGSPLLFGAFLITPLVKNFLNMDATLPIFFLWVVMALSFLGAIITGILTGWQKFVSINISSILSTIVKLGAVILFVSFGFGVNAVVGSYILSLVCGYLISWFFLKHFFYRKKTGTRSISDMTLSSIKSYVVPAFSGMLAIAILGNIDMIFAKRHLDPAISGEYGALFIVAKTIFFVTGVLTTVLFAMSSEENKTEQGVTHTFYIATILTMATALGSTLVFFFFPEVVMGVFFGQKYLAQSPLLGWFALVAGLYSVANLFLQYLLSLQKTIIATLFLVLAGLECVTLFFWGKGFYAIIAITIVTQILAVFLGLIFVLREKYHAKNNLHSHSSL